MSSQTEPEFLLDHILRQAFPTFSQETLSKVLRAIGAQFYSSLRPLYSFLQAEAQERGGIAAFLVKRGIGAGEECEKIAGELERRIVQAVGKDYDRGNIVEEISNANYFFIKSRPTPPPYLYFTYCFRNFHLAAYLEFRIDHSLPHHYRRKSRSFA